LRNALLFRCVDVGAPVFNMALQAQLRSAGRRLRTFATGEIRCSHGGKGKSGKQLEVTLDSVFTALLSHNKDWKVPASLTPPLISVHKVPLAPAAVAAADSSLRHDAIGQLLAAGDLHEAIASLLSVHATGLQERELSLRVLKACLADRQVRLAVDLLTQLPAHGYRVQHPECAMVMQACLKRGQPQQAVTVLQLARALNLPLSAKLVRCGLVALQRLERWQQAVTLHEDWCSSPHYKQPKTALLHNLAITAYGRLGDWQAAIDVLHRMAAPAKRGSKRAVAAGRATGSKARTSASSTPQLSQRDADSYRDAMFACLSAGQWEVVLQLLHECRSRYVLLTRQY
jgi:pentatricopeptide repeat protein